MQLISQRLPLPTKLLVFVLEDVRSMPQIPSFLLYLPSLPLMFPNSFIKRFAQQHATCTSGPSFPSHIPDATARHCNGQNCSRARFARRELTNPKDLITSVQVPIKRRIMKPPRIVLISGIPLCLAYREYSLTNILAERAKSTYRN